MTMVNMLEAKTNFSRLVNAIESGKETEIIIARNGRPAARLVAINNSVEHQIRLGLMDGKFPPMSLDEFDRDNAYIASLFNGEEE